MATVARQSGPRRIISRQGISALKSSMSPSALVTVGLILLIPVLATAGPIAASALIARYAGVGRSGVLVLVVIAAVVCAAVVAATMAFRLAWRRGAATGQHSFGSLVR
ncbi:hypothetical protein ACWF9G_17400 [Nocardia sp. NPDC055029]|uniref:hypothetical protein n=1 Tax=Nocardia sp. NPDC060259 TaxID=3347088 RepID=UPI00365B1545